MNRERLFKAQAELDKHIEQEKGLQGQDLLDKKILALQVELGELANEWRGFKFWSENQEPTKFIHTTQGATIENTEFFECMNDDCKQYSYKEDFDNLFETDYDVCPKCEEGAVHAFRKKYPLLEEYVDCLHFILSIGLEIIPEIRKCVVEPFIYDDDSITNQFIELNYQSYLLIKDYEYKKTNVEGAWFTLLDLFAGLGKMLGFTWEQIEQAYFDKNKINHERQESDY